MKNLFFIVVAVVVMMSGGCGGGEETLSPEPPATGWAVFQYSTQPFDMGVSVFDYTGTINIRQGEIIALTARWDPAQHSLASMPELGAGLSWRTTGSGPDGIRTLVWSDTPGDYSVNFKDKDGGVAEVKIRVASDSYPFRILVRDLSGSDWVPAQQVGWPQRLVASTLIRVEWTTRPEVEAARPENIGILRSGGGSGWDEYILTVNGPTGHAEVVDVHIGGGDWIRLLYQISD